MTRIPLPIISFFLIQCTLSQELGPYHFVGKGSSSMYFLMKGHGADWMHVFEYCHNHNMLPGMLRSDRDFQLVTQFMSTQLPGEALFLPATDHNDEGVYKWVHDFTPVSVGNWSQDQPGGDLTKNCLLINEDGLYQEESCWRDVHHFGLCETPLLHHTESEEVPQVISIATPPTNINIPEELTEIGRIGDKVFYADLEGNITKDWLETFDYCHQHGLRMASPNTESEFVFLDGLTTNASVPNLNTLHIGASDMMTISCLKGNTKFRWLVDGTDIPSFLDISLTHNSWWYQCAFLSPTGPRSTACLSGSTFGAVCEIDVRQLPVCGPDDLFLPDPDCQNYYICDDGEPILRQCPDGLYWNQELMACDFPFNVPECVDGTRPPIPNTTSNPRSL